MFYRKFGKRALDILLSGCAILALSPVLLIVAVLVRTKLGSPVLFHQERPGRNERIFTLCKFRTMTDARDENGQLLPDSERLTSFGKFLRSTSLDELPELFNIFKGDMSIIAAAGFLPALVHRRGEAAPHGKARPYRSCPGFRAEFPGLGQTACEGCGVCEESVLRHGREGARHDGEGGFRPFRRGGGYVGFRRKPGPDPKGQGGGGRKAVRQRQGGNYGNQSSDFKRGHPQQGGAVF